MADHFNPLGWGFLTYAEQREASKDFDGSPCPYDCGCTIGAEPFFDDCGCDGPCCYSAEIAIDAGRAKGWPRG